MGRQAEQMIGGYETMHIIIAKTFTGKEFMYSRNESYSVSKQNSTRIRKILNDNNYLLKDGETWHLYNVDEWELESCNAYLQRMTFRKNRLVIVAR